MEDSEYILLKLRNNTARLSKISHAIDKTYKEEDAMADSLADYFNENKIFANKTNANIFCAGYRAASHRIYKMTARNFESKLYEHILYLEKILTNFDLGFDSIKEKEKKEEKINQIKEFDIF